MIDATLTVPKPIDRDHGASWQLAKRRPHMNYVVRVGFDKDAHRYFVIDSEIPGLNVETETFEEFVAVTEDVAAELVDTADQDVKIRFEREIIVAA